MESHRYFVLNKPYDMVSQFVSSHALRLLSEIPFDFPEGTHAIGRLDKNSEGMLLLTTNKAITRLLFQGIRPHKRTYVVQVKGIVSDASVKALESGVTIPVQAGAWYSTKPCYARVLESAPILFSSGYELHPSVPHTWLELVLTEGKYHQVRKMMTAIGHPCKRLIRISIEDLQLESLPPGGVREIPEAVFFQQLKLTET